MYVSQPPLPNSASDWAPRYEASISIERGRHVVISLICQCRLQVISRNCSVAQESGIPYLHLHQHFTSLVTRLTCEKSTAGKKDVRWSCCEPHPNPQAVGLPSMRACVLLLLEAP